MTVLVLIGSPMLHSFRLTAGIDYVKLPCLRRDREEVIGVKYLNLNLDSTVGLRRELILSTVMNLRPDIFLLVDKKPGGVAGELEQSPKALKAQPEDALCYALPAGNDANERGTYLISPLEKVTTPPEASPTTRTQQYN